MNNCLPIRIAAVASFIGGLLAITCHAADTFPPTCDRTSPSCWQTLKPAEIDPYWANARCNDGTAASYDFRPSPIGSKDWVVVFEGGGGCDDSTISCKSRSPALTTTSPLANTSWHSIKHTGIINTNSTYNREFYNANLVHVNYCSSDQWGGATTTRHITSATPNCMHGDANCGWYFSGRYNARLAVHSLKYLTNFKDDGTHRMLLVGTSAGGFGLAGVAESLTLLLPKTYAADGMRLVLDGSHIIDGWQEPGKKIGSSNFTAVNDVAIQNRDFWDARYETYCERDRKLQGLDPALCSFGTVYYPYLTSKTNGLGLKVFIQNSTLDKVALSRLKLAESYDKTDLNTPAARERWRCNMTRSLQNVDWLFSSGSSYHTLMTSDAGLTAGPSGYKLGQMIGRFYRNEPAQRVVYNNPACPYF